MVFTEGCSDICGTPLFCEMYSYDNKNRFLNKTKKAFRLISECLF